MQYSAGINSSGEIHRLEKKYSIKLHRYTAALLAAVGMMLVLAGCGKDGAASVNAQAGEGSEGVTAAAERVEPTVSQNGSGVSLPEMDPETRQQLMTELLEENDMDASVVEPEKVTKRCTFEIPEGFEESQDVDNLYVTARYPLDASMIYYEVMDGDISLQLMTEEHFTKEAEESLSQLYGEEITLNMESFENVKIDGYPAFRILCRYETQGIEITQLEYIINADKTYAVTYSQTSDVDRMEEYEASALTIHVK